MSTDALPKKTNLESRFGPHAVLIPYAIAILAQLPLLLFYFSQLWARPHYQFFPLVLVMVGFFAWTRWPKQLPQPYFASKFSSTLFWLAVVFGIAGALFSLAWFTATSFVLLMTSLFSRTRDGEFFGKSLFPLCLPLWVILMPPNNLDRKLITQLQEWGSTVSSWYLDVMDFKHYSPGTTLNFATQNYNVEQACSGVQSFFLMMFCTAFLVIALRRPWFRAIPLFVAGAFWAVLMNSVRILIIAVADQQFGVDLLHGLPHDLVGYSVMIAAVGLTLSTDQLLEFLFGSSTNRVDETESRPSRIGRLFGKTAPEGVEETTSTRFKSVSPAFRRLSFIGAIVLLLFGGLQLYDFSQAMMTQQSKAIRFFSGNVLIDVPEEAMPNQITSTSGDKEVVWSRIHYQRRSLTRGADLGERSDIWWYRSPRNYRATVELDQTYPGWHELTTCYKNQGFLIASGARKRMPGTFIDEDEDEVEWQYVQTDMVHKTTGAHGYLLFCLADANGAPFEPPIEWNQLRYFFEGAKNRLNYKVRSRLFRGEAYQFQVFIETPNELPDFIKDEVTSQFLQARLDMRSALKRYSDDEVRSNSDQEKPAEQVSKAISNE